MKHSLQTLRKGEQGFTLVELAVVMIIIGILIGGILKGQELITNARMTSTVAQYEAIGAAKNDFQNQFNSLPGDLATAATRLPANCGGAACPNGSGNGIIDPAIGAAANAGAGAAGENTHFFRHLSAAGYISAMDATAALNFGNALPTAPIGGGFIVGQGLGGAGFTAAELRPGQTYIAVSNSTAALGAGTGIMTPMQASRIDTKLDDGVPNTGSVVSDTANANCRAAGAYNGVAANNIVCVVAYRI